MKDILTYADIENAPKAVGPYSIATEAGSLVFLSGQVPIVPETGKLISDDIEQQTTQVLTNIQAVLSGLSLDLSRVVKTTVFMTDLKQFQLMNAIYENFFNKHKPARSTVQVVALPLSALIEIECLVVR